MLEVIFNQVNIAQTFILLIAEHLSYTILKQMIGIGGKLDKQTKIKILSEKAKDYNTKYD